MVGLLRERNHPEEVIELTNTARSAQDAARALDVAVGAIVKTLVFVIEAENEEIPVVALVAGDKRCNIDILLKLLNIDGRVLRPDADKVKLITGFSIGGVSPVGLPSELDIIIDTSLKRFETIWSAAGHTHCVFSATYENLNKIIKAVESDEIAS